MTKWEAIKSDWKFAVISGSMFLLFVSIALFAAFMAVGISPATLRGW